MIFRDTSAEEQSTYANENAKPMITIKRTSPDSSFLSISSTKLKRETFNTTKEEGFEPLMGNRSDPNYATIIQRMKSLV